VIFGGSRADAVTYSGLGSERVDLGLPGMAPTQRKPPDDGRVAALQAENERLRAELALRAENERLRAELADSRSASSSRGGVHLTLAQLGLAVVVLLGLVLLLLARQSDWASSLPPQQQQQQQQLPPPGLTEDPEYWSRQCPPGTGFHLPGVMKCVPDPSEESEEPPSPDEDLPAHGAAAAAEEQEEMVTEVTEDAQEAAAMDDEEEDQASQPPAAPPVTPPARSADIAGLPDALEPARALAAADPWAAIELYRAALAAVGVGLPEADEVGIAATAPKRGGASALKKRHVVAPLVSALDEAAELYTGAWQHSAALATLQLAHKIRRRAKQPSPFPPAEMALSAASLAAAYGRALRYDEALSTLRTIEPLTPSLPAQVRREKRLLFREKRLLFREKRLLFHVCPELVWAAHRCFTCENLSTNGNNGAVLPAWIMSIAV
jgi:hypothetical protein